MAPKQPAIVATEWRAALRAAYLTINGTAPVI
jgi:hypothetical protein